MKRILWLFFALVWGWVGVAAADANWGRVIGLRVDPGYLYDDYPGLPAAQVAQNVAMRAAQTGINTLFVYAYNSVYGAFYQTSFGLTSVEPGYGQEDFFKHMVAAAHQRGLRVVAVMPINNFKTVWQNRAGWRVKKKNGADYRPDSESFLLSAWHPRYRNWYSRFLKDFLNRHPDVDGVEAVEGQIDYYWDWKVDFNAKARESFFQAYPNGNLGDANWKKHRALGLTELHSQLNQIAHAQGKTSFVVQTWTVGNAGQLYRSEDMRDGMGFDFDGLADLTGAADTDFIAGEFMWQQWLAEYGAGAFTPEWTASAAQAFKSKIGTRSQPIIHIELSGADVGWREMTLNEFARTVRAALTGGSHIDIYDFHLLETRGAWNTLKLELQRAP